MIITRCCFSHLKKYHLHWKSFQATAKTAFKIPLKLLIVSFENCCSLKPSLMLADRSVVVCCFLSQKNNHKYCATAMIYHPLTGATPSPSRLTSHQIALHRTLRCANSALQPKQTQLCFFRAGCNAILANAISSLISGRANLINCLKRPCTKLHTPHTWRALW